MHVKSKSRKKIICNMHSCCFGVLYVIDKPYARCTFLFCVFISAILLPISSIKQIADILPHTSPFTDSLSHSRERNCLPLFKPLS